MESPALFYGAGLFIKSTNSGKIILKMQRQNLLACKLKARMTYHFILLFFLTGVSACKAPLETIMTPNNESIFSSIDPKLIDVAKKLNATLRTESQHASKFGKMTLESRRLVWIENQIGKAITITTFHYFPDSSLRTWGFYILAWLEDEQPGLKPLYQEYLLKNVPFNVIEKNIDSLLTTAQEKLKKITLEDMK